MVSFGHGDSLSTLLSWPVGYHDSSRHRLCREEERVSLAGAERLFEVFISRLDAVLQRRPKLKQLTQGLWGAGWCHFGVREALTSLGWQSWLVRGKGL